ncbi:hypothetical protein Hanom_Chr04g00343061 [Helianthus anomalus]
MVNDQIRISTSSDGSFFVAGVVRVYSAKLKVDGSELLLGFTIRFYDYIYLFGTMFLMLNVYYYSVYIKLSIWIVFVIASHEL